MALIRKPTQTLLTLTLLFLLLPVAAIILSSALLNNSPAPPSHHHHHHRYRQPLHSLIKRACSHTLHTHLCRSTLSSIPLPTVNSTTANFLHILEFSINQTADHFKTTRSTIGVHFDNQALSTSEKNALRDCIEMLDQTAYELEQAIDQLGALSTYPRRKSSYGSIKTLLSAAMTNENTCINGFSDLEELNLGNQKMRHTEHLQNLLTPISRMISNSLALIKHAEISRPVGISKRAGLRNYARFVRRRKKNMVPEFRANAVVALNGSGDYSCISEAIAMAPNMSRITFVIHITAGVYEENVLIPREKMNIMLVGEGMNATVITGNRNFADGFFTFDSATLTVVGDKFLAMDLAIINTSPPEKHQAVALRVTANAAFLRCNLTSHQDTLYAHSLRQLYHDCTIQGTVDFIFGNAAAVFLHCTILVRRPGPGQRNIITAQGRDDPNQNTGISLQNCTIEAAREPGPDDIWRNFTTYLGRPWRNYSRAVVMGSYLGDLIEPEGWVQWNEYSSLDTVEYIEYGNRGPGADTRGRVGWGGYRRNCSEDAVRQFGVEEFLRGADHWLELTAIPLFGGS